MASDPGPYRRPVGVAPETAKGRMVVVCDDGSVWKWIHDGSHWDELSPIPGSTRAAEATAERAAGSGPNGSRTA